MYTDRQTDRQTDRACAGEKRKKQAKEKRSERCEASRPETTVQSERRDVMCSFYVVHAGRMAFIGSPVDCTYLLSPIVQAVQALVSLP